MLQIRRTTIYCICCMLLSSIVCGQSTPDKLAAGIKPDGSLPRSTAVAENVLQSNITDFIDAFKRDGLDIHSLMVVRHGKVISEQWFGDNAADKPHVLHSVSKTYTAIGVGFAVAEGRIKITDKVISFFPDKLPEEISENLASMEIRHLLTMSMDIPNSLTQAVHKTPEVDWVKYFLALPVTEKPGSRFDYNSEATFMLSAIIQKVTGKTLNDYLYPRLFKPLGIAFPVWEENDQGINKGGWGLYVKTEDMAKLGQFILQKGQWNGRQLLPESWINGMTSLQIETLPAGKVKEDAAENDWWQGYGYQMWRCRHNAFRADGAFGQLILILPEKDAVITITANVTDFQAELNLVWKYLLPALKD